jgi:hypothetical protein
MNQDTIRVLLIGESEHRCAHVRRLLEKRLPVLVWAVLRRGAALFVEHYFHMISARSRFIGMTDSSPS